MPATHHPEAEQELEAAAVWYEEQKPGLGHAFLEEFERTLLRIEADPKRWRIVKGNNRKINLHGFPYAVIYSLKTDVIFITAVMHLHRRPFYWSRRQPSP
jgi:hypothetical protein